MVKNRTRLVPLLVCCILIGSSTTFSYGSSATVISKEGVVREEPSFEGKSVKVFTIGEELKIIENKSDWYLIESMDESNKVSGWIYRDLVVSDLNKEVVKVGVVNTNVLNVRSGPAIEQTLLTTLRKGDQVTIIGDKDIWYQIQLSNGVKGWVHGNYIDIRTAYNYPNGKVISKVELKSSNTDNSSTISSLVEGNTVYIKGLDEGWYNIIAGENEGWVMSNTIELNTSSSNPVNRSGKRTQLLSNIGTVTSKYIGRPYRSGSTGPNSFDCSGFVTYIFNQYYADYLKEKQIHLPRRSSDMANIGTNVSKSELEPGDLVFFNNGRGGAINHVGIFIGEEKFIHSAYSNRRGIVISSLNESVFIKTYVKGVRI